MNGEGQTRKEEIGSGHLRHNFVSRIFAHHVQDGQPTARMFIDPRVQPQDELFEDDNNATVGNQSLGEPRRHDIITAHVAFVWGGCRWCGIVRSVEKQDGQAASRDRARW